MKRREFITLLGVGAATWPIAARAQKPSMPVIGWIDVAVLAATDAVNATKAAIRATRTTPVVFANGGDPVALGLVPSLNRPGGNATGVSFFLGGLGAKRLEMARALVPSATTVAVLANPANPVAAPELADIQMAGRALGLSVVVLNGSTDAEIDAGFALIAQQQVRALLVNTDSFLSRRRDRIVAAAARARPFLRSMRRVNLCPPAV
jgi:putative tryptophan/tyrosine transport system substrate-binding protein